MKTIRRAGFTLVEIMIVVAIIALLTAIAIPAFLRYREDARRSLCINNMRNVEHAKESYAISQNLRADDTVAWTNIQDYLNLPEGGELYCPEDDEESYITQQGESSPSVGDVSGTNRLWCPVGPDAPNEYTGDIAAEDIPDAAENLFPRHVYLPGVN